MLTFRQKILLSYVIIFLLFTALLYPFTSYVISKIQEKNFLTRTENFARELYSSSSKEEMLTKLQNQQAHLFFRAMLFDSEGIPVNNGQNLKITDEKEAKGWYEVGEALRKGKSSEVRFSPIYGQEMFFAAVSFLFQEKKYVLQAAFPYGDIASLTKDFMIAFVALNIGSLLLFGLLAWLIIHYLTGPVQKIISAIKPFQLGFQEHIPEIKLGREMGPKDEFGQLAETLNALSRRIEHQIATLINERNDKAAILESLGEGVIAVDRTMTVTYINHTAENFIAVKKENILGKTFVLAKQPRCHELIHEAQHKKEPVLAVLKPEGKPKRFIDAIAVPLGEKGAILVLQDKTSLHKVIELGRDFIANASHELKTPITIIRGFAETLHDHPELSPEVSREIIQKIVNNCQRMDILIKNLLTLAAIDEGLPRSRLQECSLFDLVSEARQTILAVYPNAHISIDAKDIDSLTLMVDGDLLLQAILNLLDNAVKYSKPPANVTVHLEKRAHDMIMKVEDRGIGIAHDDLERIFERFYAVDKSHSRSMGGSGLGLSIVERIVEKHQGKVYVESTVGIGTTFTLVLPIREEESY